MVHEGIKPFECEICGYTFGIKSDLKEHMDSVHKQFNEPKTNKAPIMPFFFGGINHFKPIELNKIHIEGATANNAPVQDFSNESNNILDSKKSEKSHQCLTCDKKFVTQNQLKEHISMVHGQLKSYPCSICGKYFSLPKLLKQHISKSHQCLTCDEKFVTQNQLKKHISLVHDQLKPHSCSICGKCFVLELKLKEHVLTVHEKLKLFQCSICGYKTGLKGNIVTHTNRMHEGVPVEIIYLGRYENYKCNDCEFKTGLKKDLVKHIREVHDGKQNWHCNICNISFKRKSTLRDHKGNKGHANKKSHWLASVDERKKEETMKSLKTVHEEGTKSSNAPVQNFSNESVHERK